jgi:SdrD B-like domain/Secretion system C-terminal sorting domain
MPFIINQPNCKQLIANFLYQFFIIMKSLQYLLGTFAFALASLTNVTAQVNITATPPPPTAPLNVCGAPAHFRVTVTCVGPSVANASSLTVQMPVGIRYVAGSMVRVSGVSGTITENAADPSAAVFALPNLAVGNTIELDYQAEADCRRINEPVNSTAYRLASSAGTQTFSGGTISNPNYNVQYAAMNIISMTNPIFGGAAGGTFTRSIKVLNGGFGSTPTLKFDATHTAGLLVQSVSVTGASTITPSNPFPAGSNTYTVTGFTGDNSMDNNDVVTITETLVMPATACGGSAGNAVTTYKAYYGCFAQNICPETNSTDVSSSATASTSWSGATAGGGATVTVSSLLPLQPACLSGEVEYEVKFTNTGSSDAFNGVFTFDARDIDVQYLTGFEVDGVPVVATNTVSPTSGAAACFTAVPSGAVYSGKINLPNIPAGATITLTFRGKRCCNSNFCYANNTPYYGFNGSLKYADACNANKSVAKKLYGASSTQPEISEIFNRSQIKDLVVFLSTDSTAMFCVDMDIVVPLGDNTGFFDFKTKMPAGFKYTPGKIGTMEVDGDMWPVAAGYPTYIDSVLTFRFALANKPAALSLQEHNRLRLCVPISADGDNMCGLTGRINIGVKYTPSNSCGTCAISLFCGDNGIYQDVQRLCFLPCGGRFKINQFDIKRTSFGYKDNNNDNIPDVTGVLQPSLLRKRDIIIGDTIAVEFSAMINDTAAAAAAGWNYGYANIFFEKGLTNAAPASLNVSVQIYDASTASYINISNLVPTVMDSLNSRRFVYNLKTGAAANFQFHNFDSIRFKANYTMTAQNAPTIVKVRPALLLTNDAAATGNSGDCFEKPNYFYLHPINTTATAVVKRASDDCSTEGFVEAAVRTTIDGDFGADLFDYEVRKTAYETNWSVALPTGVGFDFAEVRFLGDYERQFSLWLPVTNAVYTNGVVTMNLKPFYKQFGGTIENWEDRNIVQVRVHYTGANPTCASTGTSQKFISNREYANPIKAVRPTETTEVSYAFSSTPVGSTVFNMLSSDDLSAAGDTVTWMVRVSNSATGTLNNAWLAKKTGISGVSIAQVRFLNCATGQPTGAAIAPNSNGFYELGNITSAGLCLAIKATYSNCIKDSMSIISGFNCGGYPTNLNNVNLLCGVVEQQLFVRPAPTQIQQIITQEPTNDIQLCDEFGYKIAILSAQKGSVNSIKTSFVVLPGQGVTVVSGSSQVEYPHNSGTWVNIPNPTLVGSTYTWNISAAPLLASTLGAKGLFGIDSALANKNRLNLRFKLTTTPCNFKSGVVFVFQTEGKRGCGQRIQATDQVTSPIKILGAPTAVNAYSVSLVTGTARPCSNQSARMRLSIVNQGGGANGGLTSADENIEIVFYNGADILPLSFNPVKNPPQGQPIIETVPGGKVYRYTMPANVAVGDSIVFEADVIVNTNLACNISTTRVEASTNALFLSQCSSSTQICTLASTTGSDVSFIQISRPDLQILGINATSTLRPPTGETVTAVIRLRNNSSTTPVVASVPFVVKMYNDADRSGTVSTGDVLLATRTVAANILQNAIYDVTITADVAAGMACPLLATIEEAPCFCDIAAVTTTNVPVTPATTTITTCENVTTQPLGAAPVMGYTYQWVAVTPGAISFLSNPNIANPTFTNPNGSDQDFEYNLYINRGVGCLATQKVIVHLDNNTNCNQYKGTIGNYVWFDDNNDGLQNEPATRGINGVSIDLSNAGADGNIGTGDDFFVTTTVTTNNAAGQPGYYLFDNLNTGVYYIKFPNTVLGSNGLTTATTATTANNDSDPSATTGLTKAIIINVFSGIAIQKDNLTIDAGYKVDTQVGDFVWNDTNKDGIQDAGEVGIDNVTVRLVKASDNTVIGTQTTTGGGKYLFTNLIADTYYIEFDKPGTNFNASPTVPNTADGNDADANGKTANFTLNKGDLNLDIDAGFFITPLPVKLLNFDAKLKGCIVMFDWATASELNNKQFELKRSEDGTSWKTIATIRGAGTTNNRQAYTEMDSKPRKSNFYKLVQTDFDGTTEEFVLPYKIDATDCYEGIENGATTIFPNPNATDMVTFKFATEYEAETVTVMFSDLAGRLVKQSQTAITQGPNVVSIDINDLPEGAYLVRIKGNGWFSDTQKLVRLR